MRRVLAPWLPMVASGVVLLIAWQGVTDVLGISTYVLPSPSAIAAGAADGGTTLAWGLLTTMTETVAGFGIGATVGLALAVAFVLFPPLGSAAMPMVVAINAVPSVAFVPLALIWFGIGMASKIAMAALAVSFPVLVSTLAGLRKPEEAAVSLLRSFGAGRFGVLWRLRLPAAMPSLVTGLRVGLARGTVVVIVTEMLGAYEGVGQIIYRATAQVDSVTVWAAVLAASASSLLLYGILVAVDRRLVWWS